MFGIARFVLAIIVALSHAGIAIAGHHIGVPAVVVFLILSGFVVSSLLADSFPARSDIPSFYKERALRLLPLYGFFLLLAFAAYLLGAKTEWLAGPADPWLWLANILVVPLNYYMTFEQINSLFLIPVAWSLALEMQFYLLAPWLLRRSRWILLGVVLSMLVYTVASLGGLHADWFGYRLLVGNLFMFLCGYMIHAMHKEPHYKKWLAGIWLYVLLLSGICGLLGRWQGTFVLETSIGFVLGLPLLVWLSTLPRRKFDDRLGQLAYGIFLCHFPVMWLAQYAGLLTAQVRPLLVYLLLVVMAATIGHVLVERPLVRLRHNMRSKS